MLSSRWNVDDAERRRLLKHHNGSQSSLAGSEVSKYKMSVLRATIRLKSIGVYCRALTSGLDDARDRVRVGANENKARLTLYPRPECELFKSLMTAVKQLRKCEMLEGLIRINIEHKFS